MDIRLNIFSQFKIAQLLKTILRKLLKTPPQLLQLWQLRRSTAISRQLYFHLPSSKHLLSSIQPHFIFKLTLIPYSSTPINNFASAQFYFILHLQNLILSRFTNTQFTNRLHNTIQFPFPNKSTTLFTIFPSPFNTNMRSQWPRPKPTLPPNRNRSHPLQSHPSGPGVHGPRWNAKVLARSSRLNRRGGEGEYPFSWRASQATWANRSPGSFQAVVHVGGGGWSPL